MLDPGPRSLKTGTLRAPLSDRKDDLYETPDEAVHALLRAEKLPRYLWEPACGPGRIVKILRDAGHAGYASDLVDYGCPDSHSRFDFLLPCNSYEFLPHHVQAIVTNPPFKLAEEFVARALHLAPKVVMLLRLAFLESEKRRGILDNGMLARVHVFRKRLPMMAAMIVYTSRAFQKTSRKSVPPSRSRASS